MANAPLAHIVGHLRRSTSSQSLDDLSDAELLSNYRQRQDEAAFAAIVRRHGRLITAACHQLLDDRADVDDVFQATFLVFLREAKRIRAGSALGGWLYRVAYRLALKLRQKQSRRRDLAETQAPEPDLSWREACIVLHEELDRLPPKFRLPLVLCYLDGRSRDEAAKHLGWTEGMVKGRLERGRDVLRSRLTRRGVSLSAGLMAALASSRADAVSPQLVDSVVRFASNPKQAPAAAAALAAGVPTVMNPMRIPVMIAALFAAALLGTGAWLAAKPAPAEPPAKPQAEKPDDQPAVGSNTVTGRILDPDGKPVAGARLYFPVVPTEEPKSIDDLQIDRLATSDKEGAFRVELPKDRARSDLPIPILVAAEGYGVNWIDGPKFADTAYTVRLPKDHPITGRVLDTQGKPQAGLKIQVMAVFAPEEGKFDEFLRAWQREWEMATHTTRHSFVPLAKILGTWTTDKEGRFEIKGIGVDRAAQVQISGPSVAQKSIYVVTRPGFDEKTFNKGVIVNRPSFDGKQLLLASKFDFVAAPTRIIEGIVTDAITGKPLAGICINSVVGRGSTVDTTTDDKGYYKLTGIPKMSQYLVGARPPRGDTTLLSRTVPLNDTEGLGTIKADIVLNRGVVVTGRVIDQSTGKGVSAGVRFAPLRNNAYFGKKPGFDSYARERLMTSTDANGKFRIVTIPGEGVLMAQAGMVEMNNGQPVKPWRIAEFDAENAKKVEIIGKGRDRYFATAGNSTELLGSENAVKYVDLKEDGGTVEVNLMLNRGQTRQIKIVDPDGKPLEGAMVSGMTESWPMTFAIAKPECTIYALDEKEPRTVIFYHSQRKLAAVLKVQGDAKEPLTARLMPTGSVKGRMLDLDGQPVSGADISTGLALEVGRELYRHMRPPPPVLKTDAEGRFQIDGLIPGLDFSMELRKDRKYFAGEPRIGYKKVESGQTLDLGERKMKPQD